MKRMKKMGVPSRAAENALDHFIFFLLFFY